MRRPLNVKINLPKNVVFDGAYEVKIYSRTEKKQYYVGRFITVDQALKARDEFIVNNQEGCMKGYLPRGLTYDKTQNRYRPFLSFKIGDKQYSEFLGSFPTLKEAFEFRSAFVRGLL